MRVGAFGESGQRLSPFSGCQVVSRPGAEIALYGPLTDSPAPVHVVALALVAPSLATDFEGFLYIQNAR